jgi:hyperosmotically inducible protein
MAKSSIPLLFVIPVLGLGGQFAVAQTSPTTPDSMKSTQNPVNPDNTKSNRDDPSNMDQTADQQPNNATDMDLTQRIRRSVTADKNLSTYAHNVKIVTANGTVTLNGVVRSEDEKAEVGRKAAAVAGTDHVVNELKVTSTK